MVRLSLARQLSFCASMMDRRKTNDEKRDGESWVYLGYTPSRAHNDTYPLVVNHGQTSLPKRKAHVKEVRVNGCHSTHAARGRECHIAQVWQWRQT